VRCSPLPLRPSRAESILGHANRHQSMSALPPKADMCGALGHVCFGPKADTCSARGNVRFGPKADTGLLIQSSRCLLSGNLFVAINQRIHCLQFPLMIATYQRGKRRTPPARPTISVQPDCRCRKTTPLPCQQPPASRRAEPHILRRKKIHVDCFPKADIANPVGFA